MTLMDQKWRVFFMSTRGRGRVAREGVRVPTLSSMFSVRVWQAGGRACIRASASMSSLRAGGAGSRGRRIINGVSCRCTISLDKPPGPRTSGTLQSPLRIGSTRVPWKGTQVFSLLSDGWQASENERLQGLGEGRAPRRKQSSAAR